MTGPRDPARGGREPTFEMGFSRGFAGWLAETGVSLAFTNPPLKLFLIGLQPDDQLSVFERTFPRCLGIAADGTDTLYVQSRYQIWRLQNMRRPGPLAEGGYDRWYVPRKVYNTGAVGTHDVAVDRDGQVLFVNTRFGCLCTVSDEYSFVPVWKPRFIDGLYAGDRCHLNGLAMRDGRPAHMTAVGSTNEYDSWRSERHSGGIVIDVASNEIVARGLSMPHSPRWYRGRLWLTNAGTGELVTVDPLTGKWEPFCFCPGFVRGLTFFGDYAIVGSSKPREGDIYSGLELDDRLAARGQPPRLGLFIIDLRTAEIVQWLFIDGEARELYDVVVLPGVRQPMALGLQTDEVEKTIWFDQESMAGRRDTVVGP